MNFSYAQIKLTNVEKHVQIQISSATNQLTAWHNVLKQFEFVSVTQIARLNRKFYAGKRRPDETLELHDVPAEQLREMKEKISTKKFATVVFGLFARVVRQLSYKFKKS